MKEDKDRSRRIRRARTAIARFSPIVTAGLSQNWTEIVDGNQEWGDFSRLAVKASDEDIAVGIADIEAILQAIAVLLDLFDEEPIGDTYYPFKAAELIELHCRMVTGDLSGSAPVGLSEWIDRFAQHVEWQLKTSGVNRAESEGFRQIEHGFQLQCSDLLVQDKASFRDSMTESRRAGEQYVAILRSALG
ncbi:hypothetical protein ACFU76_35950 [Streptomyces sp. NPDC057539]|uniref:hypothetical protein n=1 Tax=Streptomyces sp. NPDC057539 TaxID=3346159 RepID=UPI0036CE2850